MANAEANRVYESMTADCTSLIHHAMRADGVWFTRYQGRDPRFGYKWSAWRRSVEPEYARTTERKARLPKGGE